MTLCNGGLHFHALLLAPPESRLAESVDQHFATHKRLYLGHSVAVADIHIRQVTHGYNRVGDYVFKTVLRGRVTYDDGVLLLPRVVQEFQPRKRRNGPVATGR